MHINYGVYYSYELCLFLCFYYYPYDFFCNLLPYRGIFVIVRKENRDFHVRIQKIQKWIELSRRNLEC